MLITAILCWIQNFPETDVLYVYIIPYCMNYYQYILFLFVFLLWSIILICNFNVNCLCSTLQNVMYSQRPFLLLLCLNMIISTSSNVTGRLWSILYYCFTACELLSSILFLFFLFRLEILWLTLCQFHNSVEIEVSKKKTTLCILSSIRIHNIVLNFAVKVCIQTLC